MTFHLTVLEHVLDFGLAFLVNFNLSVGAQLSFWPTVKPTHNQNPIVVQRIARKQVLMHLSLARFLFQTRLLNHFHDHICTA